LGGTLPIVNAELMRKAVEKVGNPNILVNLVSRRVRQMNSGGGGLGRPLVSDTAGMGLADIALLEIIEDKITWEPALDEIEAEASRKRRRRASGQGTE
jgi:DNA-directed RNA polymerase subunit omega